MIEVPAAAAALPTAEALVESPPAPPLRLIVHDDLDGLFTGSGRPERVHVVPAGVVVPAGLRVPGPLLVGPGARVMGDVDARGSVHLSKGASVHGALRAIGDVVVGARAAVYGPLRAEGWVHVLGGGLVAGELDAASDVILRPQARCARVLAGGDLLVASPVHARETHVRGKVTVEPPLAVVEVEAA